MYKDKQNKRQTDKQAQQKISVWLSCALFHIISVADSVI